MKLYLEDDDKLTEIPERKLSNSRLFKELLIVLSGFVLAGIALIAFGGVE